MNTASIGRPLAVILAVLAAGCGRGGGGGGSQATPQATLQNMNTAMQKGDKAAFLACWKAEADQKKALESMFDASQAFLGLKGDLERAYGPEGWKKFQAQGGMAASMSFQDLTEEIARAQCKVEGDKATCAAPGEKTVELIREGGRWLIDARTSLPAGGEASDMQKMMAVFRKPIEEVRSQIGKPDQTPESLARLLNEQMRKNFPGGSGEGPPGSKEEKGGSK